MKILNFKCLYFPLIFFVGLRGKCLDCDFIFSKIRCVYRIYLDVNALQEISKCCFLPILASKKMHFRWCRNVEKLRYLATNFLS